MRARDDGACAMLPRLGQHVNVQLLRMIAQAHLHALRVHQLLRLRHVLIGDVVQHRKTCARITAKRPQRHGNRQTHHIGAGNAHTHRILQNIPAHGDRQALRRFAQRLRSHRRRIRRRAGFRTADGRSNLLLNERNQLILSGARHNRPPNIFLMFL